MHDRQNMGPMEASLHEGPAAGETLRLRGTARWPEYVCVNLNQPGALAHHYRHVAAGTYEYQGACIEFKHSYLPPVQRCPDCGCEIGSPHGPR